MNAAVPAPRHRFWFLGLVAALAAIGVLMVQLRPELERNYRQWLTATIIVLAIPLGVIWLLFLSGFRWRTRLLAFAGLVLAGLGLRFSLRVDGTASGTGLPKFAWRWAAAKPAGSNAPAPGAKASTAAVAQLPGMVDVPQFFGPNRDGVIRGAKLARDWNGHAPRQLWRQPIGAGWSAFAVVGGRAYTQEQRGEDEAITCYELATGKLLWLHANHARFFQWQGGEGPRATPTVLDGRVYAMGATGLLDCLDAATGQGIWQRDVLKENGIENLIWGLSDSPLVFDDLVVVTGGNAKGPTVLAYRRADGQPRWRGGSDKASYSSPVLATLAGRRVALSFNAASLTAYDAVSGEEVLVHPWSDDKWPKAAQPVVTGERQVFISAGYGAGCSLLEITASTDGRLSANELWKNLRMKNQFNSSAVREGFLYGLDDGSLACVDLATGERKWKGGRYGSGQSLMVDDLALIQSESGPVVVAEAKPDGFKELGRIPDALHAKTWNYPTLAGRYLLVRNSEEAACYELAVE
jgi:outer membrane protein assembly factor BamB